MPMRSSDFTPECAPLPLRLRTSRTGSRKRNASSPTVIEHRRSTRRQAEYLGEIVIGFSFALLARATSLTAVLAAAALVMLVTSLLVRRRSTAIDTVTAA